MDIFTRVDFCQLLRIDLVESCLETVKCFGCCCRLKWALLLRFVIQKCRDVNEGTAYGFVIIEQKVDHMDCFAVQVLGPIQRLIEQMTKDFEVIFCDVKIA